MAGKFSIEGIFTMVDRMTRPIARIHSRLERFTRSARTSLAAVDKTFGKILYWETTKDPMSRILSGLLVS